MGALATLPAPEIMPPTDEVQTPPTVPETDVLKGREDLQRILKGLCKHFIGLDKFVRRQEVIDARRQRFYWRNDQYIYWKNDAVGFTAVQGGQGIAMGNSLEIDAPRYTDVYNIYTPYGESILSTLISNAPGVNWQPKNAKETQDVIAARTAEKLQQKIENDNDRKALQSDVARYFFTDGRTVSYTRRYRGYEKITIHGVLETKVVPITSTCQEDLVSITISDELDVFTAKSEYPEYKKGIKSNTSTLGESAYERIARLGVLQGTRLLMQAGDAFSHMVTRHVFFLRLSALEKLTDEEEKEQQELSQLFPDGIKVTFCGDQYCGSENVSMDDQVAIEFPSPGDGMSRPSMGKRLVPLQDTFNDEINLWHEAHDYCVPTLFMYSETGDIEGVREQISQPGNIVPFTSLPPGASAAASAFYAAVLEGIPETLPKLIEFIQGPLAQFISGAFPALFGGDTGENDTARGISIQRDQAMGRMGLPWGSVQRLFARAYTHALISLVKHADEGEVFSYTSTDQSGQPVTEELNVEDLRLGTAICVADTDASFPESTNSKRSAFQTLMAAAERNPLLAAVMAEPDNQEYGYMVMGLPDLTVPGAESRNKQWIEIEQLLAENPIAPGEQEIRQAAMQNPQLMQAMAAWEQQAQQAQVTGQPPPPKPIPPEMYHTTIDVDPLFDNHQAELETIKNWLSSDAARKAKAEGKQQGIQNVRLHGMQHQQAIQQQALQAAAMQGQLPGGPGGPPSGPPPKGGPINKNVGTQAAGPALQAASAKQGA